MEFALSTRWNGRRHASGEAMVDEILEAGFRAIELGYDLTLDLVPGVRKRVAEGAVRVVSVHNYCPVPMGMPRGHPELYTFADADAGQRRRAVKYTAETVRFAAEMGAGAVVVHAGYVRMRPLTPRLFDMISAGRQGSPRYERLRARLDLRRERRAPRHLDAVAECLEQLAPVLDETGVVLGLENLPSWEAVPSEMETLDLVRRVGPGRIGYWHDIGHGRIRENIGFIRQERLLERLRDCLVGMHVHDVQPPAQDHLVPFEGEIDFGPLGEAARAAPRRVLEPSRSATAAQLRAAADRLAALWSPGAAAPAG